MAGIRRSIAGGLAAALLGPPLTGQEPRFSGQLTIREREIVIDLPDDVAGDRLQPGDFQVLVDGRPREVSRAEPVAAADGDGPWTFVIYFDRILAGPGTVFYSGLALSGRARDLTRQGSVEVVVAGSDPAIVLAASRDSVPVAQTLAALAAGARLERDRSAALTPRDPSPLQIRRQLDKLVAFLAARPPAGPHAVFLVADGIDLPAQEMAALKRETSTGPVQSPTTPAADFRRAARLLSAYGWVTVPTLLRKEGLGIASASQSEVEIFRQGSAPSDLHSGVPPILPGRPPKRTTLVFPGVIELFIQPRTAVLRALSQATAGTVVGFEVQLDALVKALPRRWRLWITEPDEPADGKLHRLEVRLPGKGKEARAPEWIRSSTPEGIAEARLENLLAGHPAGGDLPFEVSARRVSPASLELRLELAPFKLPDSVPAGPIRISYAFPGADGAVGIRHETRPAGDPNEVWQLTPAVSPPPDVRRIAVVVEALGAERWGGKVLEIR